MIGWVKSGWNVGQKRWKESLTHFSVMQIKTGLVLQLHWLSGAEKPGFHRLDDFFQSSTSTDYFLQHDLHWKPCWLPEHRFHHRTCEVSRFLEKKKKGSIEMCCQEAMREVCWVILITCECFRPQLTPPTVWEETDSADQCAQSCIMGDIFEPCKYLM